LEETALSSLAIKAMNGRETARRGDCRKKRKKEKKRARQGEKNPA
jgi:hypothetical protein